MKKKFDLWYNIVPIGLLVFEILAKTRLLNWPFFTNYIGSQRLFPQFMLKVLKNNYNERNSPVNTEKRKNRTKISLKTKIWPKIIGFGPSDSFLFRSLSLIPYPRSYSKGYLKTVPLTELVMLAPCVKVFTNLSLKTKKNSPQNVMTKFGNLGKNFDRKYIFANFY